EVPSLAGSWIFLPRVQTVFTRFQLADHSRSSVPSLGSSSPLAAEHPGPVFARRYAERNTVPLSKMRSGGGRRRSSRSHDWRTVPIRSLRCNCVDVGVVAGQRTRASAGAKPTPAGQISVSNLPSGFVDVHPVRADRRSSFAARACSVRHFALGDCSKCRGGGAATH